MKSRHRYWMAIARRFPAVAIVCAFLAWTSAGKAEIISWQCYDGPDAMGSAQADWSCESADAYNLRTKRSQSGGPGRIQLDFTTDTPDDPKINFINEVENDSDFAWTGYSIKFTLDTPTQLTTCLLSNEKVNGPDGWTITITQQLTPKGLNASGRYEYMGLIDLVGGAPIGIGGELDFRYALIFAGSTSYTAIQDVTTIPEPGTLMLLGMGAFSLAFYGLRRRR